MTLKLVMIRCPDNVAPERREVRGGEFSIGRGKDNQWVVADPDRHLSKKHCQFVYGVGEGEWELQDLSTNGTFLNQANDPIGKGASQKLRNGDVGLGFLRKTARDRKNVFESLMEAVKTHSLGQISHALYDVGGEYRRNM